MYWFRRPPYLRWAAAALVLAVAVMIELRPEARVDHPFAARELAPGDVLAPDDVEWRTVPAGILPTAELDGGVAARRVAAGSPLLPGDVGPIGAVPDDWWSVPIEIPPAPVGAAVRIVVVPTGATVDGVVMAPPDDDPFSAAPAGLVAVPGPAAAEVAAAVARREVIVLVAP